MIALPLAEIFHVAKVRWTSVGERNEVLLRNVSDVSTDTRELRPGSLFVGLPGPRFDGADFAEAALEAGASAVLVEGSGEELLRRLAELSERYVAPVAVCDDTRAALGVIGALVRRSLGGRTLAITGSCGKTSTKAIVAHMLAAGVGPQPAVVASPKSFNNYIGVPRTLFLCERETQFAVLEVGTNACGEIADLAAIAQPDVAMITTIGRAHLQGLGCIEGVAGEKGALLESLDPARVGSTAVLNGDCPMTEQLMRRVPEGVRVLTFSARSEGVALDLRPAVHARNVRATARGTEFELFVDIGQCPEAASMGEGAAALQGRHVVVPLLGAHAAANVAAALAAVIALGGDLGAALDSIPTLMAEPHRLQPTLAGGVLVIDDAYNANPESMSAAVQTLMGVERAPGAAALAAEAAPSRLAERVLVVGAMGEMGAGRLELHHEVGALAGASGIDRLFITGEAADEDALGAVREGAEQAGMEPSRIHLGASVEETIQQLTGERLGLVAGDICLVKASRAARLERVAEALAEHFRQDTLSLGPTGASASPTTRAPYRPEART